MKNNFEDKSLCNPPPIYPKEFKDLSDVSKTKCPFQLTYLYKRGFCVLVFNKAKKLEEN